MPFDGVIGSYQPRFAWVAKFGRKLKAGPLQAPNLRSAWRALSARQSVIVLDQLAKRLAGGDNWTQGRYEYRGKYCIVGALHEIRATRLFRDDASSYLEGAIAQLCDGYSIVAFNDTRVSYADIELVIDHARERARQVAASRHLMT